MIPPSERSTASITIITPVIIIPSPTDPRFFRPFPLSLASSFDCSQTAVDQLNAPAAPINQAKSAGSIFTSVKVNTT
jgi:hypothetical protein